MDKDSLLKLITDPINEDYFPTIFLQECTYFEELEYASPLVTKEHALYRFRDIVDERWHSWLETYIQLNVEGKFPWLWPFSRDELGFEFHLHLDEFENAEQHFSLGSDPTGDWFVMTKETGSAVYLCDHHTYDLYDGWNNPDHLLAWAVRCVLADKNELTENEILTYWQGREHKIEWETIERIVAELS